MRNEQTSLEIGRLKSFDELMDEVLSQKEISPISDEEIEYLKLKELLTTYEDLYGIILPTRSILELQDYSLLSETGKKSR